jgi:uncharacterized membrane protein
MNREDRGKIIVAAFIVGFWGIAGLFFWYGSKLSGYSIFLILTVIQQIYFTPKLAKLYYQLNKSRLNPLNQYIPLLNEFAIYPSFYAWSTLILGIVNILMLAMILLPFIGIDIFTAIIVSIWDYSAAMNSTFYFIIFAIVIYVILSVIRGIGLVEIKSHIDRKHTESFGKAAYYPMEAGLYLCMFFPVGRLFAIGFMSERLSKMLVINDMSKLRKNSLKEER